MDYERMACRFRNHPSCLLTFIVVDIICILTKPSLHSHSPLSRYFYSMLPGTRVVPVPDPVNHIQIDDMASHQKRKRSKNVVICTASDAMKQR